MRYIIISILFILNLAVAAQGFRTRHYVPGALNNTAKAIFETSANNYITGGIIVESINNVNSNRLCLMGLNAQGQVQWTKKYGSRKFEYLDNPLIRRNYYKHGNFIYYTGCVRDSNNKYIGVLIKFNVNGDTIWQKIYRDTQQVVPQMVTASVDGGFLITGFFQIGTSPLMLIKTDSNGDELWRQKVTKLYPNVQDGKAIVQDSASKKIVIVGYQYIGGSNSYNNILVLDSLGVKLNQKDWDGTGAGGVLLDLIQTKDKKFVAVGVNFYPQTIGGYNIQGSYIVKFDINNMNNPIWKIYNFDKPVLNNSFNCLVELPDSSLLVGGIIDTMQAHNLPINCFARITKYNKNGALIYNHYYDYKINLPSSNNYQEIKSINLTSDGGWVAAIQENNYPSPNPFLFVKYDNNGCDSSLAYCQSVAAGSEEFMNDDLTFKIYPNPSGGAVNLELLDKNISNYTLKLTNLLGKQEAFELTNEQEYELQLNVSHLKNGIYFLQVFDKGKLIHTEKVIKE